MVGANQQGGSPKILTWKLLSINCTRARCSGIRMGPVSMLPDCATPVGIGIRVARFAREALSEAMIVTEISPITHAFPVL